MTEQQWLTSADPLAMLSCSPFARGTVFQNTTVRKLQLWGCACLRAVWPTLIDQRSRLAVETAERWVDGLVTLEEMNRAQDGANNFDDAMGGYHTPGWAAVSVGFSSSIGIVENIIQSSGTPPASQADLLRDIIGNPFRTPTLCGKPHQPGLGAEGHCDYYCADCAAVRNSTVLALAQAAYDERPGRECERCIDPKTRVGYLHTDCPDCRGTGTIADGTLDPDQLAVLSDAIEEAGCQDVEILQHLRGFERCWLCMRCGDAGQCSVCSLGCGRITGVKDMNTDDTNTVSRDDFEQMKQWRDNTLADLALWQEVAGKLYGALDELYPLPMSKGAQWVVNEALRAYREAKVNDAR